MFKVDWAQYAPDLASGLKNTLIYTALGFAGASLLGLLLALMRTSNNRLLRWPAGAYTELFKNIPLIVIIYMGYYGLAGDPFDINLGVMQAAVLSLAIVEEGPPGDVLDRPAEARTKAFLTAFDEPAAAS